MKMINAIDRDIRDLVASVEGDSLSGRHDDLIADTEQGGDNFGPLIMREVH